MDDDSKDWSPLRRKVEGYLEIQRLKEIPVTEIPESLVRSTLANELGCEPDEVTFEQIALALADLVPVYRVIKLFPPGPRYKFPEPGTPAISQPEVLSRKAFVIPILEQKGWSILDWALEANVSHATAADYLDEKTKPYRSTRVKLAKALGVPVEDLPK